jgi:hypothetical protein
MELVPVELDRKEITDSEKERIGEEAIMISFGITVQGLRLLRKNFGQGTQEHWGVHDCADSYCDLGVITRCN